MNDALSALPPFFDPDGRLLSLPAKHKKSCWRSGIWLGSSKPGGSIPKRS